uniref:Uncharacterized protein n=1 Tax=Trichogramma kaykai TaxID=54128 RepID=A0ABD2W0A4_9HYME
MNTKELVKAKNCLDYIKNLLPPEKRSKTYYHYLGKYYDKIGNYSVTKENYIKALGDQMGNFSADMGYLKLIHNTSNSKNNSEVIEHLENMLKRYENHKDRSFNIFLNLAFIYLFKNKDLKLADDNFLKALKINPCNPQLKNFHTAFDPKKKYNVFQVIHEKILIENENGYGDTLKELKRHCTEYENPKKMINALDLLDTEFVKAFAKTMSLKE